MTTLPAEVILMILKRRRNLSWKIHKARVHKLLEKCIINIVTSLCTNFDFRGYWVTYYQGKNIEIFVSQRPNWVVLSFILLVSKPHHRKPNEEYKKIIYCPVYHV